MNSGFRFPHIVPLFAALFVIACSTSPISRIDSNRDAYDTWPVEVKEAVLNQQAIPGMTPEQVEMALGKPTQVISRAGKSGVDEVWIYRKGGGGSSLLKNTGLSVGTNIGGVGIGTGMGGSGRSSVKDEQEVVFREGVVVRSGK